jgi:anti-anti-sigma regulatory factor
MFRIRKGGNGQVVFTLSGRIEADNLAEIQQQLAKETGTGDVVLDLKDVTLVNQDAVEFLVRCAAKNITLQRCPSYIRKWMQQVKDANMSVKR